MKLPDFKNINVDSMMYDHYSLTLRKSDTDDYNFVITYDLFSFRWNWANGVFGFRQKMLSLAYGNSFYMEKRNQLINMFDVSSDYMSAKRTFMMESCFQATLHPTKTESVSGKAGRKTARFAAHRAADFSDPFLSIPPQCLVNKIGVTGVWRS